MSKFLITFSAPDKRFIEAKSRAEAIEKLKSRFLITKIHYVEELNPMIQLDLFYDYDFYNSYSYNHLIIIR